MRMLQAKEQVCEARNWSVFDEGEGVDRQEEKTAAAVAATAAFGSSSSGSSKACRSTRIMTTFLTIVTIASHDFVQHKVRGAR